MTYQRKPLYRAVNTRTHGVRHGSGKAARHERNTKLVRGATHKRGSMHSGQKHGRDYTPLFKFLLSRVGQNWDDTYSEAVARLDHEDPIYWIVARDQADAEACMRVGESTYFSGLYVDVDNRLAIVDPEPTSDTMVPACAYCTHTLNGERLTRAFEE